MAEWDDRFRRADGLYHWDMLAGETTPAFTAFCVYRDLGSYRSLANAFTAATREQRGGNISDGEKKLPSGRWTLWSVQNDWLNRARQYDAYLELRARREAEAQHMADLEQFRTRQLRLARAMQEGGLRMVRVSNAGIEALEKAQAANPAGPTMRASTVASLYRSAAAVIQASAAAEAQALAIDELLGLLKGLDADE